MHPFSLTNVVSTILSVHGAQTVPRAELSAVLDSSSQFRKSVIKSDAKYVVNGVARPFDEDFNYQGAHADLWRTWHSQRRAPESEVLKVKAHQHLCDLNSTQEVRDFFGNAFADVLAGVQRLEHKSISQQLS